MESSLSLSSFSDAIFSLCSSGKGVLVQAWDVQNGGVLRSYRGEGGDGEGASLAMAGNDYLLVSLKCKPLILVWKMDREQVHMRFACTGLVQCMTCDAAGAFCIAALSDKINLWEVCSGLLLGVVSKHYQPIECLHYIDNGHFVSGGRDCLAIVWNLASVLSEFRSSHSAEDVNAPKTLTVPKNSVLRVWSDHSMPVTGIATSGCGYNRKIATSSLDQTCKIYDFASGSLLCTFLYDAPLSCIAMTTCGLWLYAGCSTGAIHCTPLFLQISEGGVRRQSDTKLSLVMKEHKKSISSLCLSFTGNRLISSSQDGMSKIWDSASKQVLLSINHKSPVVSSILCRNVWRFSELSSTKSSSCFYLPSLHLKAFQKHSNYKTEAVSEHIITLSTRPLHMLHPHKAKEIDKLSGEDILQEFEFKPERTLTAEEDLAADGNVESEANYLKQELREIKEVQRKLFSVATEHLLTSRKV